MIGCCLRTRVRKQSTIVLYFESENELKFITSKSDFQAFQSRAFTNYMYIWLEIIDIFLPK